MDFWTFDAVEERLIEAVRLWWRSPGGGQFPFAKDAPFHLMTRRTRMAEAVPASLKPGEKGEIMGQLLRADDEAETRQWQGRERHGALTRDEVALRDETSEWLGHVPEHDRKLVILALVQLAAGKAKVPWLKLKPQLGVRFGADGLRKRYSRAICGIANRLNRGSL